MTRTSSAQPFCKLHKKAASVRLPAFLLSSMAPIRRYLRITKYSVLEVRIYLETPSLADTWLLRQPEPALPRIIEAVRPLVLPKLREENERAKGKGRGKKGVRDVVSQDDFEVSIFLTEHSSRHSLLTKQKHFADRPKITSNSGKLTGWLATGTREKPVDVDENNSDRGVTIMQEEDSDEAIDLEAIPDARTAAGISRNKRLRRDSEDDLFMQESSESGGDLDTNEGHDEKKKLGLKTVYDGFSIYGRILCLVVKRKGAPRNTASAMAHGSQQMMEAWVSTQAVRELGSNDDDEA